MRYGTLRSAALYAAGDFDQAIAAATTEIAAEPDEPEPYFHRGQALAALERFEDAAADYQRALGMDASGSALDLEAVDDELFFALREQAARARDAEPLRRYLALLPEGRHVADVPKWLDELNGVERVWVRERA